MNIQLQNINLSKSKQLFENLNIDFNQGINIIKGESGSGKTTLIRAIMGLEKLESGDIIVDGIPLSPENLHEFRNNLSWIPQSFKQFRDVELSFLVEQLNLDIGEFIQNLKYFNLDYTSKPLSEYSVGELQRIFLSIAKTQNKRILIADEPSSALDLLNKQQLISYLKEHQGTVICISHDQDLIDLADKVIEC